MFFIIGLGQEMYQSNLKTRDVISLISLPHKVLQSYFVLGNYSFIFCTYIGMMIFYHILWHILFWLFGYGFSVPILLSFCLPVVARTRKSEKIFYFLCSPIGDTFAKDYNYCRKKPLRTKLVLRDKPENTRKPASGCDSVSPLTDLVESLDYPRSH